MNMSEFEFACELFGYNNVINNKIPRSTITAYMNDWKSSMMSFKQWKALLSSK